MDTEKLPLRQALFGLIFAALFVAVGAVAVSASYGNEGGDSHSEEGESHDEDGGADHSEEGDADPSAEDGDHDEDDEHEG